MVVYDRVFGYLVVIESGESRRVDDATAKLTMLYTHEIAADSFALLLSLALSLHPQHVLRKALRGIWRSPFYSSR